MRIILLSILICILVSGCGLFKKTTKHKEEVISKKEFQVTDNSKESLKANQQVTVSDKSLTINKSGTRSTIKGEKIKIDEKGNIECENCEINQEKQNENQNQKDSVAFSQSNIDYSKVADLRIKESSKDVDKKSSSVSEPSGKAIIYGSIAALILILGLLWYFGIKRKS